MRTSEQLSDLATALAKAQGKMSNATLNKVNPHFKSKYADLAAIRDAVTLPLASEGISVVQLVGSDEGGAFLTTRLMHNSGQWVESVHPLPATAKPQEFGSALTYARRYSLAAICGISAEEDDDANGASEPMSTARPQPKAVQHRTAEPQSGNAMTEWVNNAHGSLAKIKTREAYAAWVERNAKAIEKLATVSPEEHDKLTAKMDVKADSFNTLAAAE